MPLPLSVGWNRWDTLEPPAAESWVPQEVVTVVVTHYDSIRSLGLVLAGLAVQTYPPHLLQIIVADDGSPDLTAVEAAAAAISEIDAHVLVQERRGFGAGRARNMGARAATGSILIFLDCDMIPEPRLVEAHARWHHAYQDLVTLGFRLHVRAEPTAEAVLAEGPSNTLAALFSDCEQVAPAYIEGHMARTDVLTSADDDLFRVLASGNFALKATTYWRVGGFDESFNQWGGEDTELGYRLFTDGNVFVPEREAQCWHLGEPGFDDPTKQRSLRDQRALLAHLIAHCGFRRCLPGRTYARSRVAVLVKGDQLDGETLQGIVESVLSQDVHDLTVILQIMPGHPEARWIERQLGRDLRVEVQTGPIPQAPAASPLIVSLPHGARLVSGALHAILARLCSQEDPVGILHITVAGGRPTGDIAWAAHGRALRRGQRFNADDAVAAAGQLFGELWVGGEDYGVVDMGSVTDPAAPATVTIDAAAGSRPGAGYAGELALVAGAMSRLPARRRTQLIRMAAVAIKAVEKLDAISAASRVPKLHAHTRRRIANSLPEPLKRLLRPLWHKINA